MISPGDIVLRDDLAPRLGQRDDDLIQQYADIFDQLPPIEINQDNELVDGWHRVRAAERAGRTEIAYVDEPVKLVPESESEPLDETAEQEAEPSPPDPIPDAILKTARAVMVGFVELRPDDYVARLEVSANEWMTITDDSLSKELERELLTSAAAMCLWQEWMVWYLGGRTNAFTDAFGKIGLVFVRGQAGQWRIVSRLR